MKRFFGFCLVLALFVFAVSCGESKKESGYDYPDEDSADADAGNDGSDTADDNGDTADDSGDTVDDNGDTADDKDTEEPGKQQGELYGRCYPNKTCNEGLICDEENDTCIKDPGHTDDDEPGQPDEDSDNPQEPEDTDIPETPDETPEATENHKISGIYQIGSNVSGIEAALYECGGTEKIAYANTGSNGKYSFKAALSATKTYCVKAEGFASCFKGMSDHVANISEITNAVLLADTACSDLRKSETKIRIYTKLGTGEWLGELDYSGLSGIAEGLKLLSNYLDNTDGQTLSAKIAEDSKKETPEFAKFFNGFRVFADKAEVVIGESSANEALFSVEGGSTKVAQGFKITWSLKNKTAEAAAYKFSTQAPGEYTARAKLVYSGNSISDDSASVLFLQRKSGGTVYLNNKSENISFRIDDGIYGVIPKGTVVKKNGRLVNSISYDVLSAGGNQVSRLKFYPEGAVFEGDTMYFVHELGTVYGGDPKVLSASRTNADGTVDVLNSAAGDPTIMTASGNPIMTTAAGDQIMTAAAGDPIMTSAAGDPIMTSAAGDPIMSAAAGDPIMTSAAGDPIMASAAGDPIMMGTSSSTMISQTNHYSTFTVEAASLPVSLDELYEKWCKGSFYNGYSPIDFIKEGVTAYKPESTLIPYLTCDKLTDLGNDLYELINKQIGFQRNLNLFENLFFVNEFYSRMKAKRENEAVAAVKNGLELRSAIAALYTATTSYNRSTTLADMFDSSMIPLTYSGVTPESYAEKAKKAVTGNSDATEKYIATKKEMMIFANYITTSSKGPDFNNVSSVLNPDQLVCAWFNPDTQAQNCNKVYTLNSAGHVAIGGTEISVEEANAIFTKYFMPFNSRLDSEEKLSLFRTFYLALKYAGTIFYGGSDIEELRESLLKTAYLVFDGIDGNAKAVTITDTFDASAHTVQVLDGAEMVTRPYVQKLSALTDKIALKVAAASADVEKVLINIEGKEFEKVQENTRTYYNQNGTLKEKSIVLTPGTLAQGETDLKDLLGSENVDTLGNNITGKMTIVAISKISGKTYSTQKTYEFFVSDDGDGVSSKEVPADLEIYLNDSTGHAIPESKNPVIILNPGNKVYYPVNGVVSIEKLTPAAYTVDAYADGYYAKSTSVNVPAASNFGVEIRLDEELTSTADATLELEIAIDTAKHPSKVYIQIYNDDMELVANEAARFNNETSKYETLNIEINSGRYTLIAVGEELYNYLEAITLYEGVNTKQIKVVAKNACGNGIIDSAEECEPASTLPVRCGDIYPSAPNPDELAACNPNTCTFNKTACGKNALCGDGILDEGEGCDGGAKDCSEIAGFGDSRGTAPCKNDDCSGYITAGNCSKTTASCGTLPANAQWNDGLGKFSQTYDGTDWLPTAQNAQYGTTKDECVFSCIKGYKWNGSQCLESPLSLGLICTGATGCFNNTTETACFDSSSATAYGEAFFGQDAQYSENRYCTKHKFEEGTSENRRIVKDIYTHYEWQAATSENAMNWAAADEYCSTLNNESSTVAQWRIPSPDELLTIVESGTASPVLGEKFTAYGHTFWAAEDSRNNGNAWKVTENGALTSVAKTSENHVLCVRYLSNYTPAGSRFTEENETVKDNESGLMWQKQAVASRTWAEALSYCEEVSTADKFDWRLPNRNELASLIDYTKADGAMSDFPAIAAKGFWTSTSDINAAANAWTVDFADGSIKSADKTDTKYIICVRNDEPCFGSECAEPCGFNPCRHIENSTGLCTAGDYDFTCGCKSGFNWNHAKCLLGTTRYIACEGLPENAVWNTVFGISQSYDGDKWYPSETGTFNKIASNVECRFKCATNYKWDAENEVCIPESKVAMCSDKTPYSDWNVVSRISQTWNGENWIPSAESEYNEEPSEEECRFVCKEHYNWDSENKICVAETQPAACTGLPANAVWNSTTVEQTWNGTAWAPTTTGTHTTGNATDKCYFKCVDEGDKYEWKNGACSAKPKIAQCAGLPDNAEWTGGYSSITQTWNGSEWFPGNTGTYNPEANSTYCRFKCLANYNWNGSSCEAATQIANCTGLLQNAQWNTVSSIKQTFINGNWVPSTTATYQEEASDNECHFKCMEHYEWQNGACRPVTTAGNVCTGLPANAQWVGATTVEQTWNGTEWTPSTEGHHQSVSSDGCVFTCKTNYNWTNGECKAATQPGTCEGLPAYADWKGSNTIQQTWNGSAWLPSTNGSYSENAVANECRFACKAHYIWDGVKCNAGTQIVSCGTLPGNAAWNTVSQIKQTWNGTTGKWEPVVNLIYSDVSSESECRYTCKENYEWKNSACAPKKQTVACTGLPANAVWNSSTVVQEWNGTMWAPIATGTHTTGSATDKCYFKCIDEGVKFDWTEGACKGHTNSNVACDNNSLPANASWWQPSINQTWNGTEWLPTTTGSHSTGEVQNQCRFYCNNHYSWNGATCEAETKISVCGALPANAQWNTASSITQHWDESASGFIPSLTPVYGTEATTAYCRFKCKENYEWKNGSCQAATKTADCTGLPANAEWNTELAQGQITQEWNGNDWAPGLTGSFGGQDAPAANSCIFKCIENYEWQNGLCVTKKQTVPCQGLPENAVWNEVATVLQEWKGAAWSPSDAGTFNEEPSKTECRFKCKENYNWDGNGNCLPDTRVMNCNDRPANSFWNYAPTITQTWNGKEWLPTLDPEYSVAASDTECKYICETGYYPLDGECVEHPCDYSPCNDVNNSNRVCTEISNLLLPYSCGCNSGYYWYGKTGCRSMAVKLGNTCTGAIRCSSNDTTMACPAEGKEFYGQDAQYAEAGFCAPKNFVIEETIVSGETHKTVIDKNTGLEWQQPVGGRNTWQTAVSYCDGLTYGGHSDWRLPYIQEVLTIVDYQSGIDRYYFPKEVDSHWTNTEFQKEDSHYTPGDYAFEVYDSSATLRPMSKTAYRSYRCVRGTALSGSTTFTNINTYVIKDNSTQLYWQKNYAEGKKWKEALEYCENLTEGGYSDWRLPNTNELLSIVNYGNFDPASDFPDMPVEKFWTSTTSTSNDTDAFYVDFSSGATSTNSKDSSYITMFTRCVRSDLCGAGKFLMGKNCVASPCSANSCSMEHSDGICTPLSTSEFSCGCDEGYLWDSSTSSCVTDPCFDNKCASMTGSDGVCTPVDGTNFTCGCTKGYFWDGSKCRNKSIFGNICTGTSRCLPGYAYDCPAEGETYFGQDAQYAAKGTCVPKSFTNATPDETHPEEKVVKDNNTGLMWQKKIPSDKFTWYQAISYCADLEYAGYSDWRLPKPKELLSIIDNGKSEPPTNTTYFAESSSWGNYDNFWVSKKYAPSSDKAWGLSFYYGGKLKTYTNTEENSVRCVRGESQPEKSSFVVSTAENGDEIVTDTVTGLIWQKDYSSNLLWEEALEYCETSDYAGYTDWRLPNKDELISLINHDKYKYSSDFPDIPYKVWTSSLANDSLYSFKVWTVNFYYGETDSIDTGSNSTAMCVR